MFRKQFFLVRGWLEIKTLILNKPVIAIAGSTGKTTTKEMIASILRTKWKVFKSPGNRNSPEAIQKHAKLVAPYHKAIVLEFGMARKRHLEKSCRIIQPNIAGITMAGIAQNFGNFGSMKMVVDSTNDLLRYMKSTGTLFLNKDNANLSLLDTKGFKGKIITVGVKNTADYRARNIRYTKGGMTFSTILNGHDHKFFIPVYGEHNVYNALFAIAVTHHLDFKDYQIKKGLRFFKKPKRRLILYRHGKNIKIIDDTFNANPFSVKAAVDVLENVGKGTKIAVLGPVPGLGKRSAIEHKIIGCYVAKKKIDFLFTYKAGFIKRGAIESGFKGNHVRNFVRRKALHSSLKKLVRSKSTILVKGSSGMTRTVKYLRGYPRRRHHA